MLLISTTIKQLVAAFILFFYLSTTSYSENGYARLFITCTPSASNLTITIQDSRTKKSRNGATKEINWLGLLLERKAYPTPIKIGSNTHTEKCGNVTTKITYGYVNDNFSARSGADDFPVVSIYYKGKPLVPATAMEICDTKDDFAQSALGPCNKTWAEKIDIHQNEKRIFITRGIINSKNITNHLLEKKYFPFNK